MEIDTGLGAATSFEANNNMGEGENSAALGRSAGLHDDGGTFDNSFFQVTPKKTSVLEKHATKVLAIGISVGVLLMAGGVLKQALYQTTDADGRNAAALEQEIASLEQEIEAAAQNSEETFQAGGFSSAFYTVSNSQADLELDKQDLQAALDEVDAANAAVNIFKTGAAWFFLAGLVCVFVAVTIFLVAHRKPRSASIVQ